MSMNQLSVKAKVTIVICSCLIVVLATMSVLNSHLQTNTIEHIYADSSHRLSWSLSQQVEQIMTHGENENLQPLTDTIVSKGLLEEISIIDAQKVVKRSSDRSLLNRTSQDEIWGRLYASRKDTMFESFQNGKPVQVTYHVLENQAACAQCHDAASQPVLGGMKMVQSTEALAEATSSSYMSNIALSVVGLLMLVIGFLVAQNKLIFKPLAAVRIRLERAAEGDIQQTLEIKSHDEIGSLMRSIQSLIDYIRGFSEITQRMAEGDFTVQVTARSDRDVLSKSFQTMISNLNGLIQQLRDSAHKLVGASNEIASSAEQMSKGSKDQSDQVNQISAAIEEMSATILESSRNAGEAKTAADRTAQTATGGGVIVSETLEGMQQIATVVLAASQSIGKLATSTSRIGEIIGVIDDIADQTNLLALNAAIEAARAGEQGRGFAVVADEVRKLAERTAKATGEVTSMIKGIQRETGEAVTGMEEGTIQVNQGRDLADRAGNSLSEIVTMVQQVTDMITQIATAAEEQASAAEQISKNIEHISTVTRETAIGSEQSAAVAEELSHQAESLQQIVGRFKVNA
jgi:methyl-accepting chemotaxis protein